MTPQPTAAELEELLRRRSVALELAARVRADMLDAEQLAAPGDVIAARAVHKLGLAAAALERIAGRCVRELRTARRLDWSRLPAELVAAIDDLPGEEA